MGLSLAAPWLGAVIHIECACSKSDMCATSTECALCLIADVSHRATDFRFVPEADMAGAPADLIIWCWIP